MQTTQFDSAERLRPEDRDVVLREPAALRNHWRQGSDSMSYYRRQQLLDSNRECVQHSARCAEGGLESRCLTG
jgi:hypothetical protein